MAPISSIGVEDWIITTVAGNGEKDFAGDDGPAMQASLKFPMGVGFDAAGNLIIADTENHRVRRVDRTSRIITTIAGVGTEHFNFQDGGRANEQHISSPTGVAFDQAGNLFIACFNNNQVVRVGPAGTIAVVAGDGTMPGGFVGDGGPATEAQLSHPGNVRLDSQGNVHIADTRNHAVRRVDRITGIITTVAGTGTEGFSGDGGRATKAQLKLPADIAFDSQQHLLIADAGNNRIRRVDRTTGIITTVAGTGQAGFGGDGGPALEARFRHPHSLAFDAAGHLFVADCWNQRIRRIEAVTGIITTIAGCGKKGVAGDGGPALAAQLHNPALALDSRGHVHIADSENHRVRRVGPR